MYMLYSALLAAGLLASLPYWMFGKRRHGKYREGLGERLGKVPPRLYRQSTPAIWVHAVSVGEVLAVSGFWPNFLRLAHASDARVAVVNARISDRSRPGYRRFRFILKRVLRNIDLFLAQNSEDASRLREIG